MFLKCWNKHNWHTHIERSNSIRYWNTGSSDAAKSTCTSRSSRGVSTWSSESRRQFGPTGIAPTYKKTATSSTHSENKEQYTKQTHTHIPASRRRPSATSASWADSSPRRTWAKPPGPRAADIRSQVSGKWQTTVYLRAAEGLIAAPTNIVLFRCYIVRYMLNKKLATSSIECISRPHPILPTAHPTRCGWLPNRTTVVVVVVVVAIYLTTLRTITHTLFFAAPHRIRRRGEPHTGVVVTNMPELPMLLYTNTKRGSQRILSLPHYLPPQGGGEFVGVGPYTTQNQPPVRLTRSLSLSNCGLCVELGGKIDI